MLSYVLGFSWIIQKELCMRGLNFYDSIALVVLIVGGIDLGFMGLFNVNILSIFGLFSRIIFIGVGVAAGYFCYQIYLEKFKKA